jgi:endonuclease-3
MPPVKQESPVKDPVPFKAVKSEDEVASSLPQSRCVFTAATELLTELHPEVSSRCVERRNEILKSCGAGSSRILDAVISTMLSQNTTDKNSKEAYKNLCDRYPTWTLLMDAPEAEVEACIRVAGLSATRRERIQGLLRKLVDERGDAEPSFEYLREIESDDDVKKELGRFKGLGPKTISCVLLFAMGRGEFPVDTHVMRIAKQAGWVREGESRESTYEILNGPGGVPDAVKMVS